MAKRGNQAEPPREPELRVPQEEAARKLDERIAKGRALMSRAVQSLEEIKALDDDYSKWTAYNVDLLNRLFTAPKLAQEYSYAGATPIVMSMGPPSHAQRLARIKEGISGKIKELESLKERLELFPLTTGVVASPARPARPHTNRAFIVHGHDEAARESVARFLTLIGVQPIILHEQATEGRTLIEKLEYYSDVDFAVILLTPDDIGAAKNEPANLQARARQNVVLELGYFAGKLSRKNVCALYEGPLELPSDLVGVGYVLLDPAGGWQLKLARELKAAGFDIDLTALVA